MTVFQDITPRVVKMRWDPKNPGDTVDYWVDMTYWLPKGVNAVSVTVTVPPTLDQPPPAPGFDFLSVTGNEIIGDMIRVRFSGGTPAPAELPVNDYPVDFVVTADTAEVYPFTCVLPVKERRLL